MVVATLAIAPAISGKHPNNAWLIGWDAAAASATWSVDAVRSGAYEVSVSYTAEKPAKIHFVVADTQGEAEAAAFPAQQLPSPDRVPRGEVYEMAWQTAPLGRVDLPSGANSIVLTVAEPAPGFALKHVALRRLEN